MALSDKAILVLLAASIGADLLARIGTDSKDKAEFNEQDQLTSLDLSFTDLSELPPEISELTNLRKLYLSNNSRLSKLPPEIGQLTNLTRLYITHTSLSELPVEIGQLTNLRELYLYNNRLSELPVEIGQLTNLTTLDLSNNPLEYPPIKVAEQGAAAIREFFLRQRLEQGQRLEQETIERMIEFAPEHKQAGIGILNYFGEIVNQKYPDKDVKINIQQDGLKVRMTIEPPEGDIEIIEETLEEYGLVVTGKMAIEGFLDDPMHVLELKQKLEIASMELRLVKELHDEQISSLKEEMKELHSHIATALAPRATPRGLISPPSDDSQDLADQLLEILISIPALEEMDNRTHILRHFPDEPKHLIKRHEAPGTDLSSIVKNVMAWGRLDNGELGLVTLAKAALSLAKGTKQGRQLEAIIDELERLA